MCPLLVIFCALQAAVILTKAVSLEARRRSCSWSGVTSRVILPETPAATRVTRTWRTVMTVWVDCERCSSCSCCCSSSGLLCLHSKDVRCRQSCESLHIPFPSSSRKTLSPPVPLGFLLFLRLWTLFSSSLGSSVLHLYLNALPAFLKKRYNFIKR